MLASVATSGAPAARKKPFLPGVLLAGGVIVLAALAVYGNSFSGPFIFDDSSAIMENPTIRHLWPIREVLSPPPGMTVSGRPVFNFSLAVNHALGGAGVRGYHVLNLGIHIFAGLTLFGVVRRTLRLCSGPALRMRFGTDALPLALAVALLWTVHPLQTEAVTYVVQRAESLMGLFYLLTMYCFIRGAESPAPVVTHFAFSGVGGALVAPRCEASSQPTMWANCVNTPAPVRRFDGLKAPSQSRGWRVLSVAACLAGMATKEVMASAPLMVLLYDRTFVAGTFREAWRRRWPLHAGLAGTWLLLGYVMLGTGGTRSGSAGFGVGIAWWAYALTQFQAVGHYLWLSVWPHPLILDYGPALIRRAGEIVPSALLLVPLLAGTVVALWRRPVPGFAGAWFFAILAPSSSVVPVADTMFEHRVYLSLAAVVALMVMKLHALIGRRSLAACLLLAAGLGVLTWERNGNYRSEPAIWSDTVAKRPGNARAHNNLGHVLFQAGRMAEAVGQYEEALRLKPDYARAHSNLGIALAKTGRIDEAIRHCEMAVQIKPGDAEAHYNLGLTLDQGGRTNEAMVRYEEALRLNPDYAEAHNNLGIALAQTGRSAEAIRHYEEALRIKPDDVDAYCNLGTTLFQTGRVAEALEHYEAALRIQPANARAHYNLGLALAQAGRVPEAIWHYEEALRIQPGSADAHNNLGIALIQAGRVAEAIGHYEEALRIQPGSAGTHNNLGLALVQAGRVAEALEHYRSALRLKSDSAETHYNMGNALLTLGNGAEAIGHYEEALRLKPDYAEAHNNMGSALFQMGRVAEAMRHYEEALRLKPDYADARENLARVRALRQTKELDLNSSPGPGVPGYIGKESWPKHEDVGKK